MENNVIVGVVPQDFRSDNVDPKEYEPAVDADINAFDRHFQSLGNEPLVGSEKAIIKTYLHYKLNGEKHGPATGG